MNNTEKWQTTSDWIEYGTFGSMYHRSHYRLSSLSLDGGLSRLVPIFVSNVFVNKMYGGGYRYRERTCTKALNFNVLKDFVILSEPGVFWTLPSVEKGRWVTCEKI